MSGNSRAKEGHHDPIMGVRGAREQALWETPLPALPTLSVSAPAGDAWIHEIKFDGYRMMARIDHGDARLMSRNGKDWTRRLPGIIRLLQKAPVTDAVIDGEVTYLDADGRSSFSGLQDALASGRTSRLIYQVFDVIHLNGRSLSKIPLIERKGILADLMSSSGFPDGQTLRYTDHIVGDGPAFAEQACVLGLEGIVSKKADSPYRTGRTRNWLKVKCALREEFVVCGYTNPSGLHRGIGSLLLGAWDNGNLVYVGRVGTGFSRRVYAEILRRLESLATDECPFVLAKPKHQVQWVRPELVVEVQFTEWTREGRLRHPSFRAVSGRYDPTNSTSQSP